MKLSLLDIERRARARGWYTARFIGSHAEKLRVRIGKLHYADWRYDGNDVVRLFGGVMPADLDYLEGYTEAREGAARVLSVVAQVAAMQYGFKHGITVTAELMNAMKVKP